MVRMRDPKILVALLMAAAWGCPMASAQEQPNWRMELELADGVHVEAGVGTVPPNVLDLNGALRTVGVGYLEKKAAGGGSIRRILKLADGRAIVYDVVIEKADNADRGMAFRVSLKPVVPTAQETTQWGIDPARLDSEFLQSYSSPLTVKDGDILALDVLVEPRTGTRFVDYYLISNGPAPIRRSNSDRPAGEARWFGMQDIELSINGCEVWRNREIVHKSGESRASGRFVWLNIPGAGRAEFTLAPPDTGEFQPDAILNDNRIIFTLGPDRYEWLSKTTIGPGPGVFHLWVSFERGDASGSNTKPPAAAAADWKIGGSATPLSGSNQVKR